MKARTTLTAIVLGSAVALSGCGAKSEYASDIKIGNEHIVFEKNTLIVTKPNEKVIKYFAINDKGLKRLYRIEILYGLGYKTPRDRIYDRTTNVGTRVVEEAQKKLDNYLKLLREKKAELEKARDDGLIEEGLEELK